MATKKITVTLSDPDGSLEKFFKEKMEEIKVYQTARLVRYFINYYIEHQK